MYGERHRGVDATVPIRMNAVPFEANDGAGGRHHPAAESNAANSPGCVTGQA